MSALTQAVELLTAAEQNSRKQSEIFKAELAILKETVKSQQEQLFGKKSETTNNIHVDNVAADTVVAAEDTKIILVPEHQRIIKTRSKRQFNTADIPTVTSTYDLSDHEKQCSCGQLMHRIGCDVSEQLEVIPAKYYKLKHVTLKYSCNSKKTSAAFAKMHCWS